MEEPDYVRCEPCRGFGFNPAIKDKPISEAISIRQVRDFHEAKRKIAELLLCPHCGGHGYIDKTG